jgi:hypothetical protein
MLRMASVVLSFLVLDAHFGENLQRQRVDVPGRATPQNKLPTCRLSVR